MLPNKSYITFSVLLVTSLFIHLCICSDKHEAIKQNAQNKSLIHKQQAVKALNFTSQDVTNLYRKQDSAHKNKSKIPSRKQKKFNETELLRTLPLQLSQDLSVQLPNINFGSHLQSALGSATKGLSSKVLLKIHKTPDIKATHRSQLVKGRYSRSPDQNEYSEFERQVEGFEEENIETKPVTAGKPLKRYKRQTPCSQGEELDDYVDQLFRFGTRIVRAMEPITLPNATIDLVDYNLQIFLYEGKGTRAYKFKRTKPAWVFCSNETISLGLTIEVEELRVAYKYRVISGDRLIFDGDLEARLSPKLQAQFSQAIQAEDSEEPVMQRVDRIRVFRLGRVHVVIRGLGNLTQSLSMIINSYLNDNQEELQPTFRMVEGDAVKMINKMLANVNVPLLNVV